MSPRALIVTGVAIVLLIVAALIGHAISSSDTISAGDCVQTSPSALSGWDIKKVSCGSGPDGAFTVQKVASVIKGTNGDCGYGYTTFEDDPNSQTYCLTPYLGSGGGG